MAKINGATSSTLTQRVSALPVAERRRWDRLAQTGPNPVQTDENLFNGSGKPRDEYGFRKERGTRRPTEEWAEGDGKEADAIVHPDFEAMDRDLAHSEQPGFEEMSAVMLVEAGQDANTKLHHARRYVGEVINITDFQRAVVILRCFTCPKMSFRRVAAVLKSDLKTVFRNYTEAVEKFKLAPPVNGSNGKNGKV